MTTRTPHADSTRSKFLQVSADNVRSMCGDWVRPHIVNACFIACYVVFVRCAVFLSKYCFYRIKRGRLLSPLAVVTETVCL